VATVVHHSTWVEENLHERHPLFLSRCWRQGNQESLKELKLKPTQMYCPVNEMQATGIPALYVFMHSQSLLNKEVLTAIEKRLNLQEALQVKTHMYGEISCFRDLVLITTSPMKK
jgi:hypothetical protein